MERLIENVFAGALVVTLGAFALLSQNMYAWLWFSVLAVSAIAGLEKPARLLIHSFNTVLALLIYSVTESLLMLLFTVFSILAMLFAAVERMKKETIYMKKQRSTYPRIEVYESKPAKTRKTKTKPAKQKSSKKKTTTKKKTSKKSSKKSAGKKTKKFVASHESKFYHTTDCSYAKKISRNKKVKFSTKKTAKNHGYKEHDCCR